MLDTGYLILGLNQQATTEEVKQAFRDLAVKFHPDKNPENFLAEEKFKLLQRAYKIVLEDADQRENNNQRDTAINSYLNKPQNTTSCRRKRRGTRSDRKFNWQLEDEYVGTNIRVDA